MRLRCPGGDEFVGHAAGVQLLQRAGVHGERPGQVGPLGVALEYHAAHPGPGQVTGQQQAGRARADDHHVNVDVHLCPPVRNVSRRHPVNSALSQAKGEAMLSTGTPVGTIQPYFLTQAVPDLDRPSRWTSSRNWPRSPARRWRRRISSAGFIEGGHGHPGHRHLRLPAAARRADRPDRWARCGRGRARGHRPAGLRQDAETATRRDAEGFGGAGGDPAPAGTHLFLARAFGDQPRRPSVQVRPIPEEAINPGSQIMHQKYIVRDAGTPADAAVLMGSANFTTDAWGIQENNVLVITGAEDLAAAYERDFTDLWTTQKLAGTGAGDAGGVTISGTGVSYSFAPGEGKATETAIAALIAGATRRIRVASMVLSSPKILQALLDQINAGLDVAGIYDGPEMAERGQAAGKRTRAARTTRTWRCGRR